MAKLTITVAVVALTIRTLTIASEPMPDLDAAQTVIDADQVGSRYARMALTVFDPQDGPVADVGAGPEDAS